MKAAIFATLAATAAALPGMPQMSQGAQEIWNKSKRQADAAAAAGLDDPSIANFALTLEWLEATFYQQCTAQLGFPAFQAAGLTQEQFDDIVNIGNTEFEHASFLQGFLAQNGASPVEPCQYQFPCSTVQEMVVTAAVLENVGISAYAGAAALITDPTVLTAAATILTIEARHQTFIRTLAQLTAVPQAFDATLSPRLVFSLAAPFVVSCPEGSNLQITPFPTLTITNVPSGQPVAVDSIIQLQSDAQATATSCAFVSGGVANGIIFTPFDQAAGCVVPQTLAGISYVMLTDQAPLNGDLPESSILAGPAVLLVS